MNNMSMPVYSCLCLFSPVVGAESAVPLSGGSGQVPRCINLCHY